MNRSVRLIVLTLAGITALSGLAGVTAGYRPLFVISVASLFAATVFGVLAGGLGRGHDGPDASAETSRTLMAPEGGKPVGQRAEARAPMPMSRSRESDHTVVSVLSHTDTAAARTPAPVAARPVPPASYDESLPMTHHREVSTRASTAWASGEPIFEPDTQSVLSSRPDAHLRRSPSTPVAPVSAEPHDVVAALQAAVADAGTILSSHLWLEDRASSTLRLVAASGELRPIGDPKPLDDCCMGRALRSGAAILCPETRVQSMAGEHVVWRYAVPLTAGEARGVAAVDIRAEKPDMAVLTTASSHMRSSLTGALALQVAREQTRASNTLLEAVRDLSRLVDPDAVLDVLLQRAMSLSNAQTGSVMLVGDDGRLHIARAVGLPDDVTAKTSVSKGDGIAGWVLATCQSVLVEDLQGRGPKSRRHGVRSAVSVPIADDDGILGVLNVGNRTFRARFSASHREALETLGRIGALSLRNARAIETSRDLYFDTLKALAIALETKDPYSRGATERVVDLACDIAKRLGMNERDYTAVRIAAMFHDVGMSAAGDAVAVSDKPLSTVEWGMVKVHPVIAADVLEQAPALREAIPIVYHHHERYDGQGYVVGLAADMIPLGARVLAVADAFVAMTSDRPYRAALTQSAALAEMRANAGTQFDPGVVAVLEDIVESNQDRSTVG